MLSTDAALELLRKAPFHAQVTEPRESPESAVFARLSLESLFPGVPGFLTIAFLPQGSAMAHADCRDELEGFLLQQGRIGTQFLALVLGEVKAEPGHILVIREGWILAPRNDFLAALAPNPTEGVKDLVVRLYPPRCLNPYQSTLTVHPKMFFGRREEVGDLAKAQSNYVVVGPRRVGKSSLARRVLGELRTQKAYSYAVGKWAGNRYCYSVCFLDMHTLGSVTELWRELPRTMELEDSDMAHVTFRVGFNGRKRRAVMRTEYDQVKALLFEKYRHSLILLDEVDQSIREDRESGYKVFGQLQGLIDNPDAGAHVVLFGYEELLRAWSSHDFPLNGHRLKKKALRPLAPEDVGKLVKEPMDRIGLRVDNLDEVRLRIHRATAGMPNLVQQICKHLVDLDEVNQSKCVNAQHVTQVLRTPAIVEGIDGLFEQVKDPLPRLIAYSMTSYDGNDFRIDTVLEALRERKIPVHDAQVEGALNQLWLYSIFDTVGIDHREKPQYTFASSILKSRLKEQLVRDPRGVRVEALEQSVRRALAGVQG